MKKKGVGSKKNPGSPSESEKPEVYALNKGKKGWTLSRRNFLASAAAVGAALTNTGIAEEAPSQDDGFQTGLISAIDCKKVRAHKEDVSSLALTPEGKILVTGSHDDKVKIWSLESFSLIDTLIRHKSDVFKLAISADGKWLVSGSKDREIKIWRLTEKGARLKNSFTKHEDMIHGVAITPDSRKAVSVSKEGTIMLWTLPNGKLIKSWEGGSGYLDIYALALSPDGKILATGGNSRYIELWSMEKGKEGTLVEKFDVNYGIVYNLAFSPDGKWLASARGSDNELRIWNIPKKKIHKIIYTQYSISVLAFSPDGKYIAAGGYGGFEIIKLPKGRTVKEVITALERVLSLAFSLDGKMLISGYREGYVKFWSFPKGKELRCLIDLKSNLEDKYGIRYKYKDNMGRWVEVTVPACNCAPPMPEGAVCTCNTVPGDICSCVGYICSCVGHICSCHGYGHYWYPN